MEVYRIAARNKEGTEAYAERIRSYTVMEDGMRCYVQSLDGSHYVADISQIVVDPVVIRETSAGWLYKIQLKGE